MIEGFVLLLTPYESWKQWRVICRFADEPKGAEGIG